MANEKHVDTSDIQAITSLTDNGHACVREGYPILLLRKSVIHREWGVPKALQIATPENSELGGIFQTPKLEGREPTESFKDHYDILRVLRKGYVYVLAGTESKKDFIRYYQVLEGGILRESSPEDFESGGEVPFPERCLADNHFIPASFISVDISEASLKEAPFLWIAYSRYAWNKTTRDYYKKSQDLTRFTKVDLTSFIQSPGDHLRGLSLKEGTLFYYILEFLSYTSKKVGYLPNYKKWSDKVKPFTDFVKMREKEHNKQIGAVVLEDVLGVAEDLNFQRLAEVNYTGDINLDNEIIPGKSNIPYRYNELHTTQGQYKKLNYDLIEKYKLGIKQYFNENSKSGYIDITSFEDLWDRPFRDSSQYSERHEAFDIVSYKVTQDQKSRYDFDQYWEKLNNQLNVGRYTQFSEVVDRYERIKKNNGRDYTLYCRWLFCENLPASDFFSGRKQVLEDKSEVTFPEQKISSYNTLKFWEREYDYDNAGIHNDILGDAIDIFRTTGTSYYDMGLWDELLSGENTYFHQVAAGKDPVFWKESNVKSLSDKASGAIIQLLHEYYTNPLLSLISAQNALPEVASKHLENFTKSSGVQQTLDNAGHLNASTQILSFTINTKKINELSRNNNITVTSKTEIPDTKKTNITLTVFCDDDGLKNIENYINRTNRGDRATNNIDKLTEIIDNNVSVKTGAGADNPKLVMSEFEITLPSERFNQLDIRLKEKHGNNFDGFELVETKNEMVTAKFKGRGTQENIDSLKKYLQTYASFDSTRFATVKTAVEKISNNGIDITIHANTMSEASQELGNIVKESGSSSPSSDINHPINVSPENPKGPSLRGAHAATSASIVFELLLLAWQGKLLNDNLNNLDKANLTEEERSEIVSGLVFSSVAILINTVKVTTETVNKLAGMAGKIESRGMIGITSKAAVLSERLIMKALIGMIGKIDGVARVWGVLEGVKDMYYGIEKYNSGFGRSGAWQFVSGAFLILSSMTGGTGIGLAISILSLVLSLFCAYMSELSSLTLMERWFDRCYFGLNELKGKLSRYELTEDGIKKLIHGFYGAARGYALFLTKKSQSNLLFLDLGSKQCIYLNLILPSYQAESINYYGVLIIHTADGKSSTQIGHELSNKTMSTTTIRDTAGGSLLPLEMKIDFTIHDKNILDDPTNLSRTSQVYSLNEQGSLLVCQELYVADDNVDKQASVIGYIAEHHEGSEPFIIELEDYIAVK